MVHKVANADFILHVFRKTWKQWTSIQNKTKVSRNLTQIYAHETSLIRTQKEISQAPAKVFKIR